MPDSFAKHCMKHEVYIPRIQQGNACFAANVLGAGGALLSVLVHFFERGRWDSPYLSATQGLGAPELCHPKRCAPNRGEPLLQAANEQNSAALIIQSSPMPSVPLQQDYARSGPEPLQKLVLSLMRPYHLAPSLGRSLPQWSLDKRRSLPNATRIGPRSTEAKQRARRSLRPETVHHPSARSEHRASRIFVPNRNRPKSKACMPKRGRLLSTAQSHSAAAPVSKLVGQSASLLSAFQ